LGLSIVKGFTEALNGQIKLINKAEGGSEFIIEMKVQTMPLNILENE
jgi:two-component system sensor histidine kinase KdpD